MKIVFGRNLDDGDEEDAGKKSNDNWQRGFYCAFRACLESDMVLFAHLRPTRARKANR